MHTIKNKTPFNTHTGESFFLLKEREREREREKKACILNYSLSLSLCLSLSLSLSLFINIARAKREERERERVVVCRSLSVCLFVVSPKKKCSNFLFRVFALKFEKTSSF